MRSLSSIGSRSLAHRKGRSLMTASGIVLGVAILFGVLVSNASINRAFDDLVSGFGRDWVDVVARPVGAYDGTMPAETADAVARFDGVEAISPNINANATVMVGDKAKPQPVTLVGLQLEKWRALTRDFHKLKEGRFYNPGAPEVVIGSRAPKEWKAKVGGTLRLETPAGPREVTVVGQFAPNPDESGDNNDSGVQTSAEFVRQVRPGSEGRINNFIVRLADDVVAADWIAANRSKTPPGVDLEVGSTDAQGFRPLLATIQAALTFIAAIALFVGAFLIYLTLSMSVVERTRMYGTLRALGATRRQVRKVVLTEAAVLGVVSTVLGVALGLAISFVLVGAVSGLVDVATPAPVITAPGLLVAAVAGVLTTLVASLVPARRAARLSPVEAMKGDPAAEGRLGRSWIVGAVLLPVGAGLSLVLSGINGLALATFVVLTGAVLLVPLIVRPLSKGLGLLTRSASPGVGPIAVMHLVKERSRSAYTLALVMVVLAMTFTIAAANVSMRGSLSRLADANFGSDLRMFNFGGFDDKRTRDIVDTPGIEKWSAIWFGSTSVQRPDGPARAEVIVVDPATYFDVAGFVFTDGDSDALRADLERGGVVAIAETMARRFDLEKGDRIELATAEGTTAFSVGAVLASFGGDQPIVTGVGDGRRYFRTDGPSGGIIANVAEGQDLDAVRKAIVAGPGKQEGFFIQTAGEFKAEALSELNGFFSVFYAILLVAGTVGVLGLGNTLAMSVLQRFREIGILRAVGTRRRQVRSMVLVESTTLALVALVLSLPLGAFLSVLFVRTSATVMGSTVPYVFPWTFVPVTGALAAIVAALAAIGPARRASRLQVVTALQFE